MSTPRRSDRDGAAAPRSVRAAGDVPEGRPGATRRRLLAAGLLLHPLAAALLAGCRDDGVWPAGMAPIKWDRDPCSRCGMVISDRRFAAQLRGGPKDLVFKFDDIGCATTWCSEKFKDHPWIGDASTRFWVADGDTPTGATPVWLDARQAHYLTGRNSPMGYNLSAHAQARPGSLDFDTMARTTSATFPAGCLTPKTSALRRPPSLPHALRSAA